MKITYAWRGGKLVNKATGEPDEDDRPFSFAAPYIVSDIKPYRSVVSNKMIDGRLDRREDLKRTGCREVDPSEYTPTCRTEKWARRLGVPQEAHPVPQRLPNYVGPIKPD